MEEENSSLDNIQTKFTKFKIRNILVIAFIIISLFIAFINNRTEYLKIKEIGKQYVSIFEINFYGQLSMFLVTFMISYLVMYINNRFIKRGLKKFALENEVTLPKLPNKSIALIVAVFTGVFATKYLYEGFLMFTNTAWFGKKDPVFGKDIGVYMFILPFIKSLVIFLIVFFLCLVIYTAIYYVIAINICFKDGVNFQSLKKNTFVKQIQIIVMIFSLLMSGYILLIAQDIQTGEMISIKDSQNTTLVGAGLSDVSIKLWGYRILSVVVFISVVLILRNVRKGQLKKCIKVASIIPIYLVFMFVVIIYFQEVYVGSSELDKEKQYIKYNIENTKEAYGIDIEQQSLGTYDTITAEETEENIDTINNIPLISKEVTIETVTNMQDNSTYYNYDKTDLAIIRTKGEDKLVYITPREIFNDYDRSYNNETYEYTHGYSVVISSATNVDKNGYVQMIQSEFENSKSDAVTITEPRIYFGTKTNSIILTNSDYGEEFDYPLTSTTYEENVYDGEAGLNLGFIDRLVVGIKNANIGIVFSGDINKDTKVITTRNILERAKTLLPYIKYDNNPYLVITDEGRLVWVIDGYTTSNNYPYSQTTTIINENGMKERINYISNSVKVLIDAYDGTTTFYITDRNDPIIMMYNNLYPDLFSKEDIPSDIEASFKYPQYLFDIQADIIATYHDISEDILYRADDIWEVTKNEGIEIESEYMVLKQKNSDKSEFGLVVPFSKFEKESLTGYLVGTYEDGVPKLSLYKFPSDSSVAGISQMNSLIEQDEDISKELETLEVAGTQLVKNMIMVPINDTLLYVEAIHQERLNEPETKVLKKVIVASGNKAAIGNDLKEAMINLLSDNKSSLVDFIDMDDMEQVIDSIIEANNNLQESIEAGNLEMIGKDMSTLEQLIDRLEKLREAEKKENKKSDSLF